MNLGEFKLERYFAKYEFNVRYLLSPSDCETFTLAELLLMADEESAKNWSGLRLGYTESNGSHELREEIASLYPGMTAEHFLVAAPEEAIFIALNSLLEPGAHVIAVHPAYQSLHEIPRALGCSVTGWQLELRDGAWFLDPGFLDRAITDRTKLIIINFPHNPTGYLPSTTIYEEILSKARKHGIYVFSDEMYRLMEHQDGTRLQPACLCYDRGISLFGLSKSFGLPGLRIGWLACQNKKLLQRCAVLKDYTTICSSAPGEMLAIIALRAKDQIVARNNGIVSENLRAAGQFFSGYPEIFQWIPPRGGSTAFPGLNTNLPVEEFCSDIVMKKNLMILPGSVFDVNKNHFRVGLGRKDFPAALAVLKDYISSIL